MRRGNKWHHLPLEDFFWDRVIRRGVDECWLWRGAKYTTGYGEARGKYAHRVSWEFYNRRVVPKGMLVLHTCDNRSCVNPDHLYIGTDADNMRDARQRCRYPGGAKSSRAKLTSAQVKKIKHLRRTTLSSISRKKACELLGPKFHVTKFAIISILSGKTWTHIP